MIPKVISIHAVVVLVLAFSVLFRLTLPCYVYISKIWEQYCQIYFQSDFILQIIFWYIWFFLFFFRSSCKSTKSFSIYKSTLWIQETNWTLTSWSYWTYGYFKSYFWGPFLNYFTKETNQKSFLEAKNEAIKNLRKPKKNTLHCHTLLLVVFIWIHVCSENL